MIPLHELKMGIFQTNGISIGRSIGYRYLPPTTISLPTQVTTTCCKYFPLGYGAGTRPDPLYTVGQLLPGWAWPVWPPWPVPFFVAPHAALEGGARPGRNPSWSTTKPTGYRMNKWAYWCSEGCVLWSVSMTNPPLAWPTLWQRKLSSEHMHSRTNQQTHRAQWL